MSILDKHLNTIVDFGIDAAIAGVKLGLRKRKERKEDSSASTIKRPISKTILVDGAPTLITIHPAK